MQYKQKVENFCIERRFIYIVSGQEKVLENPRNHGGCKSRLAFTDDQFSLFIVYYDNHMRYSHANYN